MPDRSQSFADGGMKKQYGILNFFFCLFFITSPLVSSCKGELKQDTEAAPVAIAASDTTRYYQEEYRPQFHFSPEEKWMNDPNGLVYNAGIYHLFYQYYPDDIVWGPMHWGHATSEDLIHWEHQPIALYPDKLGYIFSGSAVVDHGNSSGLGEDGMDPLVAVYTYHDPVKEKAGTMDHQTQGIAYSNDNGKNWIKYPGNPVLPNKGKTDFRDPKVMWHAETGKWIMSLAVGDHAEFYASPDLKTWSFLSEFGKDMGAHGGVWECPDLIPMRVEGGTEEKWVLLISINPGGPNGGSATQYFVGEFDGTKFTTDQKKTKWLDYGADNYAGVTFNNAPGEDPVFIGWMSNWNYARNTPTEKWRSAMTLPRHLYLEKDESGYFVSSKVIPAFDSITKLILDKEEIKLDTPQILEGTFDRADISWSMNLKDDVTVKFQNKNGEYLVLLLDPERKQIVLDRRHSGKIDFHESFADKIHSLPYDPKNISSDIRIVMDRASIEVFIDGGRYVMTEKFFPNDAFTVLQLTSSNGTVIRDFTIKSVANTWNNE